MTDIALCQWAASRAFHSVNAKRLCASMQVTNWNGRSDGATHYMENLNMERRDSKITNSAYHKRSPCVKREELVLLEENREDEHSKEGSGPPRETKKAQKLPPSNKY